MLVGPGWTPVRVGWVWLDMAGHGWVSIGPHWTLAPLGWVPNGVYPPHWGPIGEVGQCEVLAKEVDRIRVISLQSVSNDSLEPGEENLGSGARGSMIGADPLTNIFALFFVFVFVLRALKQ